MNNVAERTWKFVKNHKTEILCVTITVIVIVIARRQVLLASGRIMRGSEPGKKDLWIDLNVEDLKWAYDTKNGYQTDSSFGPVHIDVKNVSHR